MFAMTEYLPQLIRLAGGLQLSLLVAAMLVPWRLGWKDEFHSLPKMHRQLVWTYAGYVDATFAAMGVACLCLADELASGHVLARAFCCYAAVFWTVRVVLQFVFDAQPYLTTWWLAWGNRLLTVIFTGLAVIF